MPILMLIVELMVHSVMLPLQFPPRHPMSRFMAQLTMFCSMLRIQVAMQVLMLGP
jgi:hypothetical protein